MERKTQNTSEERNKKKIKNKHLQSNLHEHRILFVQYPQTFLMKTNIEACHVFIYICKDFYLTSENVYIYINKNVKGIYHCLLIPPKNQCRGPVTISASG